MTYMSRYIHIPNKKIHAMKIGAKIDATECPSIHSTYRYAIRIGEESDITQFRLSPIRVWVSPRYECLRAHTHSKDTQMRVLSHNIDWTTYLRVPLEAGSRNIAVLRGNRNRRRVVGGLAGWDRRWLVAPGEAPVVDEETEEKEEGNGASLGDNDIAPGHLSCSRVQRITQGRQRGMQACPGSHQVASDWLMADPIRAMLLLSPETRSQRQLTLMLIESNFVSVKYYRDIKLNITSRTN